MPAMTLRFIAGIFQHKGAKIRRIPSSSHRPKFMVMFSVVRSRQSVCVLRKSAFKSCSTGDWMNKELFSKCKNKLR